MIIESPLGQIEGVEKTASLPFEAFVMHWHRPVTVGSAHPNRYLPGAMFTTPRRLVPRHPNCHPSKVPQSLPVKTAFS